MMALRFVLLDSCLTAEYINFSGTATGGGSNFLEDSNKDFSNTCSPGNAGCSVYAYGIKITGGTGAGQFRLLYSAIGSRLAVTSNWDIIPSADSTYELRQESEGIIQENSNFWTQRIGTFNGTGEATAGGGVGCGTLAARPAICKVGVGYWATNQSCTDMTGMVGANPTNPISGTLYKCTAPNTWTAYYTPYPYPHPLRTKNDTTSPAAPRGLTVN